MPRPGGTQRGAALAVVLAVTVQNVMEATKVNVALPSIQVSLGTSSRQLLLVVAGYVMSYGLALVPSGRLGDQRSRKGLLLIGMAIFAVASVGCAVAPTGGFLVFARIVQGIGAGIQMPQSIGFIQQLYPNTSRGRAIGLLGGAIAMGTALGPLVGGFLIQLAGSADGWRATFWINLPVSILITVLAAVLLPAPLTRPERRVSLDMVGVLLLAVSTVCLLVPFLLTTGSPDDSPWRWLLLIPCLIAAICLVRWERRYLARGHSPLLPLELFRIPAYRRGTLISVALFAAAIPGMTLTSLYVQGALGRSALEAGIVTVGYAVANAAGSWTGGALVGKFGSRVVVVGLIISILGVGLLIMAAIWPPPEQVYWTMLGVWSVSGFGIGMVIAPNQALTLADVRVDQASVAAGVIQLGQRFGAAIGIGLGLSLYSAVIFNASPGDLPRFHEGFALGTGATGALLLVALALGFADLPRDPRRGGR